MAKHKTALPFNKVTARVDMLIDAAETLELIFNVIQHCREHDLSMEETVGRVAGIAEQSYDSWQIKHPAREV